MNVDAVEQRPGNFRDVALDLRRRAVALARGIAEESARARIHRRGQHEARRKSDRQRRARDRHAAVFERLAHHFEHVALKFRQLVEKNDAVVAERNFSGPRHRAAADQARVADGVVRRTKRPRADQTARIFQHSCHAVNARGLDGFLERHRRQNRGNALGQHGFARAGRPDEQNVVAARAGHFERALRRHLPAHVAQVHGVLAGFRQHLRRVHRNGLKRFRRVDQIDGLRQRFHREHFNAFDHGRFARIRFRHHHVLDAAFARSQRRRERAAHRPHAAIERKFAQKNMRVEHLSEERTLAADQAQRHRQIERRSFLAYVGGREIYGDRLIRRKIEAAISERGLNSLAAFFHRDVRQADDVEISLVARPDVHLDFDEIGINAEDCGAKCFEEHSKAGGPERGVPLRCAA